MLPANPLTVLNHMWKLYIILFLSSLTEWFIKKFYPDFHDEYHGGLKR